MKTKFGSNVYFATLSLSLLDSHNFLQFLIPRVTLVAAFANMERHVVLCLLAERKQF
jgi:hypothetical protein